MPTRQRIIAGLLLAATTATDVHAAAFQLKEDSAVGLGTAFAGAGSAAASPATAFDNPAAMTELPGLQIQLGGSLIAPSFVFHGSARNAFGQPVAGADDRDGGNIAALPHGYATYRVSPDVTVGLAVTSPFGLATTYGANFVGRYQADKTELQVIDINPSLAVRVTDWLSLGAGLSADHTLAEFATGINSASVGFAAFHRFLPLSDGLFRLRGDDWSWGYNVGALIRIDADTHVGLTYRSRINHEFSSTATFDVPFPLSLSPAFRNGAANAKLVLPDTAGVSVTHRFGPQWTGYADVTWTDWSLFKTLAIYRDSGGTLGVTQENYHNSFFVTVGASYALSDTLTLRAGTAFDKTPVQDAYRGPRVPDANRYWLAGGVSYKVLPNATVDAGYAHLFVDDATVRQLSSTGDLLAGTYSNSVDIVSLGLRLAF